MLAEERDARPFGGRDTPGAVCYSWTLSGCLQGMPVTCRGRTVRGL